MYDNLSFDSVEGQLLEQILIFRCTCQRFHIRKLHGNAILTLFFEVIIQSDDRIFDLFVVAVAGTERIQYGIEIKGKIGVDQPAIQFRFCITTQNLFDLRQPFLLDENRSIRSHDRRYTALVGIECYVNLTQTDRNAV